MRLPPRPWTTWGKSNQTPTLTFMNHQTWDPLRKNIAMPFRQDEIVYLRGLAARLRSIAIGEQPRSAMHLLDMADEAEQRATQLESSLRQEER